MNLSRKLQQSLDGPVKSFEVAFRCYVADTLLTNYPSEADLKAELQNRVNETNGKGFLLAGKLSSAKTLLKNSEWKKFWDNITFIKECYVQKQQVGSHDVTDLGDTILISFLFQKDFKNVAEVFGKIENYITHISAYHSVRNSLSHRGSHLISEEDAKFCVEFMKGAGSVINPGYFWYCSFNDIKKDIDDFECELQRPKTVSGNLEMIPFPTNQIVCREPEIEKLFKCVCGLDGVRKLRNCKHLVCISGYGGIGKTSLVTEFLSRLLDAVETADYGGFKPSFILFYSAKVEMMEYNQASGELYLKGQKSQITDFESFTTRLYKDLSVDKFDDDWNQNGILIIDNLETLSTEDRKELLRFIDYDLPTEVHVVITTRIPENADEQIQLKGFQDESGIKFIEEYIQKNQITLDLSIDQKKDLVKYSYGNSLVLVLAIKRLETGRISYRSILADVLDEWIGENETESLSICRSFAMYDIKKRITIGNAEYEIDNMNREFDEIERLYIAHPYTYYQRARILKELRQDGLIDDSYNNQIKKNYESCLMLIDAPQFKKIKSTKTYPSILWNYGFSPCFYCLKETLVKHLVTQMMQYKISNYCILTLVTQMML